MALGLSYLLYTKGLIIVCIYRAAFRIKELLHIRGLYSPWRGVSILEVSGIISITEIKKAQCASWCTNCPDSRIQFFRT